MRKTVFLVINMFLFAVCAADVSAQFKAGSSEIGLTLGAAIPLTKTDLRAFGGKNETAVKSGSAIGGRYLYHSGPSLAFGVDATYAGFGDKKHDVTSLCIKDSASSLDVEALAKYTFSMERKIRPYFIAGLGYGSLHQKAETRPAAGYAWSGTGTTEYRENYDKTFAGAVVSIGAGIETFISDSLALSFEGRWKHMAISETFNDKLGAAWDMDAVNSVQAGIGLSLMF